MLLFFRGKTCAHEIEFPDLEQPITVETRPAGKS
jgi:hypothetical protein